MNPIILDTDPGIDDAVAIVVLHHYCKEELKLIFTTYGNTSIENTTRNALTLCSLLNWNIPVVKGTAHPDNDNYEDASHIHGADGLGGLSLGSDMGMSAIEGDTLLFVYEKVKECKMVDYITIGPLTNLARLIRRFPDVKENISRVICMGGGISMGNVTPDAEFNMHCDPQSADYVFKEMPDIALIPLNTTSNVFFQEDQIDRIGQKDTPIAKAMEKILMSNYHNCIKYGEKGSTMHDATAILFHLFPEHFQTRRCRIAVDCNNAFGKTFEIEGEKNVLMTVSADSSAVLQKIADSI